VTKTARENGMHDANRANIARRRALRALLAACGAGAAGGAFAQDADAWPSRPIRVIVPAGAGSGTDIIARFICERLALEFGQSMVIENKPGASGAIGTDLVAKARPDGHTLLFSNTSFTSMLQALSPKLPYDLLKDLVPIVQIGAGGVFLAVAPSFPAKTLREFVDAILAAPDRYSYGSWGVGSSGHLIMEGLKARTGMRIQHVPYKTTSQIQQDLQSGALHVGWSDMTSALPLLRGNRIRALAVTGRQRAPASGDIPTMAEQGFGFDIDGWYAMLAPAATPAAIVTRVNAAVNRVMQTPEWGERLLQLNIPNANPNTPAQFAQTVQDDIATWTRIVRDNAIRID
jgi:tripartite-type tricarboxylate transporter receptor subunit TctC